MARRQPAPVAGRDRGRPAAPAGLVPVTASLPGPAGLPLADLPPLARRRQSMATTAALAAVLIALGVFSVQGNLQTTRATLAQRHGLEIDAMFTEARSHIALEQMYARQYQVEPLGTVRARYVQAAANATEALERAARVGVGRERTDALRLLAEQAAYRRAADRLLDMIADTDPAATQVDRLEVVPAFYTLQADIDAVAHYYHAQAQRQVDELRTAQVRTLYGITISFLCGLVLVAVIWRLVLGYQRRLAQHADSSRYMALHDALTGLPNRALFHRRLTAAIEAVSEAPGDQLAVMIIDLNGFKGVNDTLGHQAGDELLVQAGRRLQAILRDGDMVARLGGDEFAVLLAAIADVQTAHDIAERLSGVLRNDFMLRSGPAAISGAIGLAIGPDGGDADDLVRHADTAMYRAKTSGRGVAVYHPDSDVETRDRLGLFGELRAVLDAGDPEGQLVLYFQPQVRVSDATVTGVEALVRWRHPQRGLLAPAAFLPLAETGGLEIPLTYHLLRVAVEHAADWHAAGDPLVTAVNVSPRCLLDEDFVPQVLGALETHGLPAPLLRLELTESTVMDEPERAVEVLHRISATGVSISIDDFGSGYSSLSQLRRLPADELKIDRSFIFDLAADRSDAVLVRGAIELAHNLDLSVVAEGVEDLETLALLGSLGCDYAQGFGLSRPVPAESLAPACATAAERALQALGGGPGTVPAGAPPVGSRAPRGARTSRAPVPLP